MARRFRPLAGSAMAVRCRFGPGLYRGGLPLARGWGTIRRPHPFAADLLVFPGWVTAKEIRPPLVARAFAGSFPGIGCPFSAVVDLFRSRIGLVIAAVCLFAAAGPDPSVVAAGLAVAGFVAAADSGCPVCPSAAATGKGRVVAPVAFCFLGPRSSSLRNRSFLLPLCFAVPT